MALIKHVYKQGSPGWWRAEAGVTLTQIKQRIKAGESRKAFRKKGLIA